MMALDVVISDIVTDFQPCLSQVAEAAAVEQFGFKQTPKRLGVGVVVTVAAPAHALHGLVTGY